MLHCVVPAGCVQTFLAAPQSQQRAAHPDHGVESRRGPLAAGPGEGLPGQGHRGECQLPTPGIGWEGGPSSVRAQG